MKQNSYNYITKSESSARKYVLGFCYRNSQRTCPRCRHRKFYRMSDGRRRCSRCRYTYHDFSGRWIDTGNISCIQWLRIIKSFEEELSTRETATRLGVSYDTAYKAVTTIRLAILDHAGGMRGIIRGETGGGLNPLWARERGMGGQRTYAEVMVFGIRQRQERVSVQFLPDLRPGVVMDLDVRKAHWRNIVYTDMYDDFDCLLFCSGRQARVRSHTPSSEEPVYVNGTGGFWSYIKGHVVRYRRVSPYRFPLYLSEFEFRYNHRKEDTFPLMVKFMCDFRPPW
jgi:transposase